MQTLLEFFIVLVVSLIKAELVPLHYAVQNRFVELLHRWWGVQRWSISELTILVGFEGRSLLFEL